MRVEWDAPVTLHIHPDVTDPRASQLRRSDDGVVQLLVGSEVDVHVRLQDAAGPVAARTGEILEKVASIELDHSATAEALVVGAPVVEALPVDTDDTVVSADAIVAESDATVQSLTRGRNDVDDTIIGQPAFVSPMSPIDDETILGQPPVIGVGADDPDASADTIIGAGRNRPESPSIAAEPRAGQAAAPVLPPPLPAMPSVSASQHVNAHVSPTGIRRTRVESPESSGQAPGTIGVSFPDGRIVELHRTVYVGRSPKSPRITSGLVPELVAVVSPRREVSSTHLEILQEGRAVVVRDLGSTNGTRVSVPGAAPSLLSPGASRVVAPGTLLDLGDDVVLEIVAPPGAAPGDGAVSW